MLKCIVFCLVLISVTLSAIVYGPLEPKPDKFSDKEGCYISELDTVVPYGQTVPSKTKCLEYVCGGKHVQHVTCSALDTYPPCKIVEDEEKPYPECCPRVICPDTIGKNTRKGY